MSVSFGPFDPSKPGEQSLQYAGPKAYIVIYNISDYQLNFTIKMSGNAIYPIVASRAQRPLPLYGQNAQLQWTSFLATKNPVGPQNLYFEIFDTSELNSSELTFISPSSLTGSAALSATVDQIVNDGNPANTQIIESTVAGDSSSCVTLTNDGVLHIGNNTHHGKISVDNGAITSDGNGDLSVIAINGASATITNTVSCNSLNATGTVTASGKISVDNGAITSDGNGDLSTVSITTSGSMTASGNVSAATLESNTLYAPADSADVISVTSGVTRIQSSGSIWFQSPGGTTLWSVDGSGGNFTCGAAGGGINYHIGRIKSINFGNNTSCGTGGTTISHGLDGTPNTVVGVYSNSSGSATSRCDNLTSTTFQATVGVTGGLNWIAYR